MWCCCVGDGHMCKDKHCWRGLVISKQHVSIINTCADTCQHECVLLYVHACTHVCVYIYTIIYICTNIYIYSSPLLPFRRETLGAGDWKGEASKTDSVQTETPEDCKHSAPLCFLCQRSSCWSDVKPPILPLEPRIYEPSLSRALCSSQRVNTTTHSRRDAHIIFIHLCREARRVKTPIVVLRQC